MWNTSKLTNSDTKETSLTSLYTYIVNLKHKSHISCSIFIAGFEQKNVFGVNMEALKSGKNLEIKYISYFASVVFLPDVFE